MKLSLIVTRLLAGCPKRFDSHARDLKSSAHCLERLWVPLNGHRRPFLGDKAAGA